VTIEDRTTGTGQGGAAASESTVDADREHLHQMGYAQELKRGMGTFSNFAISFSIISILAGGWTSFWLGMNAGGPIVILLGWVIVGFFALIVGMSMGEICSTYPTAGGLYYWSAKLATKNKAAWSWFTGWFNLLGQVGVIASVDFALATFISYFAGLYASGYDSGRIRNIFLIYLAVLIVHGLLNTFSVNLVRLLGDVSVWWHVLGVVVIVAVLLIAPDNREGVSILNDFKNTTGWTGGIATPYAFMIGLLLAQYTITGFDASAHVSEETRGARVNAPKAIVRAIYISAIAAFVMNLAMLQAIPKGEYENISGGFLTAAPQLMVAALSGPVAKILILISIIGQFFCGMASVTANSRMVYAFSRDGGLPFSSTWHKINPKTRTPTNAVWLGVGLSAVVGCLVFIQNEGYSVAFFALTGICVVGLYIAYVIPIILRLRNPDFAVGPWNLGRYSRIVGWTAVAWVGLITVLFFVPAFYPWDTLNTFNFTGPLIVGSFALFGAWYWLSAKKWFTGPRVQGTREELLAIERELDALGT
jgi:amino acid transporter